LKTRFGDLSEVSKTNRIIAAIVLISLISLVVYVALPEETQPTLEVYSFEVQGEVTLRCEESANYTKIALAGACPVIIYPIIKTLYFYLNLEKGTVMMTSQLQFNETEIDLLWSITVTGVTANTSRGLIKSDNLVQVSFLPPRTIITIASFSFLEETYIYRGQLLPTLDLPSSPPTN